MKDGSLTIVAQSFLADRLILDGFRRYHGRGVSLWLGRDSKMMGRGAFRCKSCGDIVAVDVNVLPKEVLRCTNCGKFLGRVDSVCADIADATCTMTSQLLRLTLEKMADADDER